MIIYDEIDAWHRRGMNMKVNFGEVAKNYAKYRNDLPKELIEGLKMRGVDFKKKRVLDLGSGSGILSRIIYKEGAEVVGVEPSVELIGEARKMDRKENIHINYLHEHSESMSLGNSSFEYVTVMRAWHWFDREKTLCEVKRILKDDGTLLVMDSGFMSGRKVVADTLSIVKKYLPGGELKRAGSKAVAKQLINSFPAEWFREWSEHGFELWDTYGFEYMVPFTNEEWCGRVGSLSWLSLFNEEKRAAILNEIFNHLIKEYGDIQHHIEHSCHVAILKQKM